MNFLLLLSTAFIIIQSLPIEKILFEDEFREFARTFERKYTSPIEYKNRLQIFTKNVEMINEHNAKRLSWTMGITQFADWNEEEIRGYLLSEESMNAVNTSAFEKLSIPKEKVTVYSFKDWRQSGVIGNVKDQGQCGGCWSFATIASIEAQWAILGHGRQVYSEQHLIDCDSDSYGCNGGFVDKALIWSQINGNAHESDYHYHASNGNCQHPHLIDCDSDSYGCNGGFVDKALIWSQINGNAHESDYHYHASNGNCQHPKTESIVEKVFVAADWGTMVYLVDKGGPIAFSMFVPQSFMHYTGGVYEAYGDDCSPDHGAGGHGMAIIGYGNENGKDYWLVRNSWGSGWGDQGYVKIRRGVNICSMESWGSLWPKCHGMDI